VDLALDTHATCHHVGDPTRRSDLQTSRSCKSQLQLHGPGLRNRRLCRPRFERKPDRHELSRQKTFAVNARDKAGNPSVVNPRVSRRVRLQRLLQPTSNPPTLNTVEAGKVVTMSFSLAGNQGMGIIATGYPQSRPSRVPRLRLPAHQVLSRARCTTGRRIWHSYYEQWTSSKVWSGTCRQVTLRLTDGTDHIAYFSSRSKPQLAPA